MNKEINIVLKLEFYERGRKVGEVILKEFLTNDIKNILKDYKEAKDMIDAYPLYPDNPTEKEIEDAYYYGATFTSNL